MFGTPLMDMPPTPTHTYDTPATSNTHTTPITPTCAHTSSEGSDPAPTPTEKQPPITQPMPWTHTLALPNTPPGPKDSEGEGAPPQNPTLEPPQHIKTTTRPKQTSANNNPTPLPDSSNTKHIMKKARPNAHTNKHPHTKTVFSNFEGTRSSQNPTCQPNQRTRANFCQKDQKQFFVSCFFCFGVSSRLAAATN